MSPRLLTLLGSAAALLLSLDARALNQPNGGPQIPQNGNLKGYLDAQGESIDPLVSAAVTPQTFDPACNLTFTVIARGGGQINSFGWYNVVEGQKPPPSDLHEFLTCEDGVGQSKTLSIKADPKYKGGKIGFFMATTEGAQGNCVKFDANGPIAATLGHLFYSENQYNDDNTSSNGFIHLLILDSGVFPKAFYFGWEDLYGGGDNDFEDLLTRVEGITCAGGGDPCDTGVPGICAAGVMQCHEGKLACQGQNSKGAETCNGIDDDCNGMVDDGPVCPTGEVCFQGSCVGKCSGGEFQCPASLECDNQSGFCVDPLCKGKTCPAGAICKAGACKAPCDGVKCPGNQVCRLDVCVDPCAGLKCDDGTVCDAGVCREKCGCGACPNGLSCLPSGLCADAACAKVTCNTGTVCKAGTCVDACKDAICPGGETCSLGKCVASGAGGAAGSSPLGGGGSSPLGGGGSASAGKAGATSAAGKAGSNSAGKGGAAGKGGTSGQGGSSQDIDLAPPDEGSDSGCGCRAAPGEARSFAWAGIGLGLLAAGLRRAGRARNQRG